MEYKEIEFKLGVVDFEEWIKDLRDNAPAFCVVNGCVITSEEPDDTIYKKVIGKTKAQLELLKALKDLKARIGSTDF